MLVLVLLIVALVAGLSVKFAAQYQLGLARAETRWHGTQARAYLEGTEEIAKLMFPEQGDLDKEKDFLGEPWGMEVPIEDEGVSGFARMTDAIAQLNLNDLAGHQIDLTKPEGAHDRYSEPQRRFIRLLQTFPDLPLDRNQAEMLLAAVVDWMDGDEDESGPGGAESNFYQGMEEPYRTPNAFFKSVDELRLVRGFNETPMLVTLLQPFITVLPVPDAGLNINTLSLVGPYGKGINNLLLCLNSATELVPMNPEEMAQFFAKRPPDGWDKATMEADWNSMFSGNPLEMANLDVRTRYFWLNSTVQLVDQRRSMRSLMMRNPADQSKLIVIRRDDVFELPTVDRTEKDEDGDTELVE